MLSTDLMPAFNEWATFVTEAYRSTSNIFCLSYFFALVSFQLKITTKVVPVSPFSAFSLTDNTTTHTYTFVSHVDWNWQERGEVKFYQSSWSTDTMLQWVQWKLPISDTTVRTYETEPQSERSCQKRKQSHLNASVEPVDHSKATNYSRAKIKIKLLVLLLWNTTC